MPSDSKVHSLPLLIHRYRRENLTSDPNSSDIASSQSRPPTASDRTHEPRRIQFPGAGASLSALVWGDQDRPLLILVHGIRDAAHAFDPVARALAENFRVVVPDLRGHGESPHTGDYTLMFFMADLHKTLAYFAHGADHPNAGAVHLVAHSLGGHIASNYAGLFPDALRSLTIIEGLGPPSAASTAAFRAQRTTNLIESLGSAQPHRSLASLDIAAERLQRNNPRLPPTEALRIAEHCTRPHPEGGLQWRFDPRVEEVWGSVDHETSKQRWREVVVPTQIITAELAMEYWARTPPVPGASIPPYPTDDLTEKLSHFAGHRQIEITGAGHMVHYDQPAALAAAIATFVGAH